MKKYIIEIPEIQIKKPLNVIFKELKNLLGLTEFEKALNLNNSYPSPVQNNQNSSWLKKSKIIGINPRIIKTYFNIVKYAMTFPEDTIHIMPLWEVGCDGGIYARTNWKLNSQWLDSKLVDLGYDTPEKQLKLTVNLLHAIGKRVGFDAVGHTDKFSEEVFIVPECFEWIKLDETKTKQIKYQDSEEVYTILKETIINFLKINKKANGVDFDTNFNFFGSETLYEERVEILFGTDLDTRTQRRISLMNYVRENGFETIPVTEHAPCRPITFLGIQQNENGNFADFEIKNKDGNAIIFNALTPYRWYKIDKYGYPDINKPITETFEYFFNKISEFQKEYNFDFLRADMAHNQISHAHISEKKDENYDSEMWKLLKAHIQTKNNIPYFSTYAEAFLSKYYIGGYSDMKNKNFDIVLGTSNFMFLNEEFVKLIKHYSTIEKNYNFSPCIVSITNDSDKKENNKYHQSPLANEIRYFIQLMYSSMAGYTGMGFEIRNNIPQYDSEFSGAYTNYQADDYKWGQNGSLFKTITKIRKIYSQIITEDTKSVFLSSPSDSSLVWVNYQGNEPKYLFAVNFDGSKENKDIYYEIPSLLSFKEKKLKPVFSLKSCILKHQTISADCGIIKNIDFGDAIIYKFEKERKKEYSKKNKNQILIVTTEYAPYAKSGGLADFCSEFAIEYKQKYKNSDLRIIMPLYNSKNAKLDGNGLYIELYDKFDNNKPIRYAIKDTGIQVNYSFGIYTAEATLYKIAEDKHNIPIYLIYSPTFSKMYKEYEGNLYNFSAAFTSATTAILKELKTSKEKFNPYLVITNDYLCANVISNIKNLSNADKFYSSIKTIHIIHNSFLEGTAHLTEYFISFLTRNKFEEICENSQIQQIIQKVIEEKENSNDYTELNNILKYKYLDKLTNGRYNITNQAIYECDKWITVAPYTYNALINGEHNTETNYKDNLEKGIGLLSGINYENFNPQNSIYPYNENTFEEGKLKNKIFLQNELSTENTKTKNINTCLFSAPKSVQTLGYLDKNPNSLLLLFAGRTTDYSKGIQVIMDVFPRIINEYKNVQIILASPTIISQYKKVWNDKQIKNILKSGQLVIIENFINIQHFFAGADIFLSPSLIETCGLAIMQSMRYGALPVASSTGAAPKVIIPPSVSVEKANGFITTSLYNNQNMIEDYYKELKKALDLIGSDTIIKNKLVQNAMKSDFTWNKSLEEYHKIFEELKGL